MLAKQAVYLEKRSVKLFRFGCLHLHIKLKRSDTLCYYASTRFMLKLTYFVSEHPGNPVLSNCPTFVIEGDDVNCSCQTSGSPPAVVTWIIGVRTDNSVLLLKNVSRSLDGHNYTCNQYWGGFSHNNWKTTTYTVHVNCEWIKNKQKKLNEDSC